MATNPNAPGSSDPATPPATTDPAAPPASPTAPPPASDGNGEKTGGEATYSQAQVDAMIADRLERERRHQARQQQEATDAAQAATLAEQKRFEELAGQHKAKLDELSPQLEAATAENATMKAALEKFVAAQREGRSAAILALLDKMPLAEQSEWLTANPTEGMAEPNGKTGPARTVAPTPTTDTKTLTPEQRRERAVGIRQLW